MNKAILTLLVGAILFGVVGLFALTWGISTYNDEAARLNSYNAKLKENTASFDNMWKSISQSAQVADKQKEALKDIFTSYASSRNGGGNNDNLLMKWIQESVPNVDTSVYRNLQNIILTERDSWTTRQIELVRIAQEYNEPLVQFPTNIFLKMFGFEKLDAKVITSSRTEKAFETGKDDEVKL